MPTTLTALCTRSGGWWAVEVPRVQGLFTQTRTLDEVPSAVLDAAALLTGRPEAELGLVVTLVLDGG